ncbi:unnamed protein product [Clonostachys rosea]|uniref:Fe2OG dioxygenase domain-containing protein n=1 Tax=Bionectria ochroleuca TaxID=29856 RepID=A0ABY6U0D7_BIOOC|nr:unnamed protein product [Clonostachys rosea]
MSMTITKEEYVPTLQTLSLIGESQFKVEVFTRDDNVEDMINALKYNGGIRVKSFLTADEIKEVNASVRPALEKASYARPDDPTKRLARLPEHSPEITRRILQDEIYTAIMDRFLSVKFESWLEDKHVVVEEKPIVAMSSIFEVGPGMHVQDLHRDDSIWYNEMPPIKPEDYKFGRDVSISFFIAGSKTTEANGATRFIPGSHLTHHNTPPETHKAVTAELEAGDAFFMLSSCYHGAGQNSTKDEKRLVYALFSQKPHLRQEENYALFMGHDLIRSFPLDVQRRLGFDVALPNLGWVDHASPLESVLKQKGADKRQIAGYNPVDGVADERALTSHELAGESQ